ncbi:MAG TPA: hypothetical protein VGN42_07290 [Pirellulales bacterium]|jgi:hypothetical protein|nr:hypothetical protein [Pirellulales bacterium]
MARNGIWVPADCLGGPARSNGIVKRRFLQFSLRGLLGFAAFACLLFGTWHWLEAYGTYVSAVNPKVGEPIRIKARYFWPFGPDECVLDVGHSWSDEDGCAFKALRCRRSWLCFYNVEYDFDPVDRHCQIFLFLNRRERGTSWTVKEETVDVN